MTYIRQIALPFLDQIIRWLCLYEQLLKLLYFSTIELLDYFWRYCKRLLVCVCYGMTGVIESQR